MHNIDERISVRWHSTNTFTGWEAAFKKKKKSDLFADLHGCFTGGTKNLSAANVPYL